MTRQHSLSMRCVLLNSMIEQVLSNSSVCVFKYVDGTDRKAKTVHVHDQKPRQESLLYTKTRLHTVACISTT